MKNNVIKTGLKIGATTGGLALLSLRIVPACSSAVGIVVGILLATIMGSMWFPSGRRVGR